MTTREKLYEAVRTIKEHCKNTPETACSIECPLYPLCDKNHIFAPVDWPDLKEGGQNDVQKQ